MAFMAEIGLPTHGGICGSISPPVRKPQPPPKKKLDRGEPGERMTVARVAKLEVLGFAWDLSAAAICKQVSKS